MKHKTAYILIAILCSISVALGIANMATTTDCCTKPDCCVQDAECCVPEAECCKTEDTCDENSACPVCT